MCIAHFDRQEDTPLSVKQEQHLENSYSKTKIGLQNQIMNTMDMWRRKEERKTRHYNN